MEVFLTISREKKQSSFRITQAQTWQWSVDLQGPQTTSHNQADGEPDLEIDLETVRTTGLAPFEQTVESSLFLKGTFFVPPPSLHV